MDNYDLAKFSMLCLSCIQVERIYVCQQKERTIQTTNCKYQNQGITKSNASRIIKCLGSDRGRKMEQ